MVAEGARAFPGGDIGRIHGHAEPFPWTHFYGQRRGGVFPPDIDVDSVGANPCVRPIVGG